ncbi:hypothetical protein M0R88_00025 [Halorussus gelatinilyticus]|uniref:Uncharacterized protein n=1 Tax=Halorussus gelatinilyticus TaxID=2937524 RepID=A0A8U0IHF8_9EURY|nr:hypothetical protein [Halorussus gelatinilyticus]UPW00507.1 hypothetical protein M0R88_00025 [Halorussus gelatinilyticus]
MKRRELLRRSSGLAAVAGLSGCVGSSGTGSSPGTTTDGTTDDGANGSETTEENRERFGGVRSDDDEPFRTITVGDRESVVFPDDNRPRGVRVWNAADRAREIDVEIAKSADVRVDRTVEFAADAYLELALNEPANYSISVGLADASEATTFGIERSQFDCNRAGTDVGVMPDGRVETVSESTTMGCPAPEVADSALSVGRGECGKAHSATVAFEGEAVAVDGAVRTPTPRSDLELAAASYDRNADALTVRVAAKAPEESGVGTQCIGEVAYEATVNFEHALPQTVSVVHESMDETVGVTTKTR